MKKLFVLLLTFVSFLTLAQELPTEPQNGFAFPLGSKFTIKLYAVDSANFDYSIIEFEPFEEIVNTFETDSLFAAEGQDSTIAFYFCIGTHGDDQAERDSNMQVLLLMKNYTKMVLEYSSDIMREEDGEFAKTSNIGTFPGAVGVEMWPYMIHMIGLAEFRKPKK